MKKTISAFVLSILFIFSMRSFVYAETNLQSVNNKGSNITWNYDSSSEIMYVEGTGEIEGFDDVKDSGISSNYSGYQYKNIVISEGITSIGDFAFIYSPDLESITFPSTLKKIGKGAFYNCQNLEHITFPSGLKEIGKGAFCRCFNLTGDIVIPEGVEKIEPGAFMWTNITGVTIPYTVTEIGAWAFTGYSNPKLTNVTFSNITKSRLTKIGSDAFAGAAMKSISLPASLTEIGEYAFCHSKIENITIPKSTTLIDQAAFQESSLKSITILNPQCRVARPYGVTIPSTAKIIAHKYSDAYYYAKDCHRAFQALSGIKLSKKSVVLKKGKSVKIKVSNIEKNDSVKSWTTGSKKIATVTSKGVIKARKKGKTTIKVLMKSGQIEYVKVKVK